MKAYSKKKLRSIGDTTWYKVGMILHPLCEVCHNPTSQIHHFFFKGSCGQLRYDLDNGVGMCMHCHSLLHFKDAKLVESVIIEARGQKWYNELLAKAREKHSSFVTVGWYKAHIERLKAVYDKL